MTNKINKCDGNHGGPRCADPECWNDAPVPPAGGEPEVRAAFDAWFIHDRALDPQTDTTLIDGPFEPWRAWKACADQYSAHVTQLQAEVERLNSELMLHHSRCNGAYSAVLKQNDALQSELTKARELIQKISDTACGYLPEIKEYLSNQSAPADKGQGEPVACAHGIRAPHACDQCEAQNAVPDYWEDPDTGTCIDQWSKIQGLNGTEAYSIPLYRHAEQPAPVAVLPEKYDDVLLPFLSLMRAELHTNAHKGDRLGWLQMDRKTAVLEVFYHMGKLHMAVHRNDKACITEYAADVANMCMMLTDVCGCLNSEPKP